MMQTITRITPLLLTLALAACGSPSEAPAPAPEPAAEAAAEATPAPEAAPEPAAPPAMPRSPATPSAGVSFANIADGDTVASPVTIQFNIVGMDVAPAGTSEPFTGHHHLIIDADLPAMDQPIPADDNYRHFGKGQTEVTVELTPGTHTLQLLLGDGNHVPHEPPVMSDKITITVE